MPLVQIQSLKLAAAEHALVYALAVVIQHVFQGVKKEMKEMLEVQQVALHVLLHSHQLVAIIELVLVAVLVNAIQYVVAVVLVDVLLVVKDAVAAVATIVQLNVDRDAVEEVL